MPALRDGLLAEFTTAEQLVGAAKEMRGKGYTALEAFTPYPVHGIDEAIGHERSSLSWVVFFCALFGGTGGYLTMLYCNYISYNINVGGRPSHAAPAFIPITFESVVLTSALTAILTLCIFCGLPRLWHPVFEVEGFERHTVDRFWLGVDRRDARFDLARTRGELEALGPARVSATVRDMEKEKK